MLRIRKGRFALLLVALLAVTVAGCRPGPDDPLEYLHREDAIIIQMVTIEAGASAFERRLAVPEFTLYGDGTLIYKSADGDGTRLLQTALPGDAVLDLLEGITEKDFLNFAYEQPAGSASSAETTFIYVHTRRLANAVSIQPRSQPEDRLEDQLAAVLEIRDALSALDLVARGGGKPNPYVPDAYLMVLRTLDGHQDLSENVAQTGGGANVLEELGKNAGETLEQLAEPVSLPFSSPPAEAGLAPLLPFYQNFPEFDLP